MEKNKHCFILFLIFGICLFLCFKQKKENVKVKIVEGVTVVQNLGKGISEDTKFIFEEDLTIGVLEGDSNYVFYLPIALDVDASGNIYVLDTGDHRIRKYDNEGKYLTKFGRKGKGPGEFLGPSDFVLTKTGQMYILDNGNNRVQILNSKGQFIHSFEFDTPGVRKIFVDSLENVYLQKFYFEGREVIEKYNQAGESLGIIYKREVPPLKLGWTTYMPILQATMDSGGNLYICWDRDYEISVYSGEGRLIRKFTKKHKPQKINREEIRREHLERLKKKPQAQHYIDQQLHIPEYYPVINGLHIDEENRTWVEVFTKEEHYLVDLFNEEGYYLTRLKIEINISHLLFRNSKVYAIVRSNDVSMIKRYRILVRK